MRDIVEYGAPPDSPQVGGFYKYRSPLIRYVNGNHWTVGVVCVAGEADGVQGAADCDQGHSLFLEV